jgi:hypothetical protein
MGGDRRWSYADERAKIRERLEEAVERLPVLAAWHDVYDRDKRPSGAGTEVQDDLRQWAPDIRSLLDALDERDQALVDMATAVFGLESTTPGTIEGAAAWEVLHDRAANYSLGEPPKDASKPPAKKRVTHREALSAAAAERYAARQKGTG